MEQIGLGGLAEFLDLGEKFNCGMHDRWEMYQATWNQTGPCQKKEPPLEWFGFRKLA
jgi:hypothetical protein